MLWLPGQSGQTGRRIQPEAQAFLEQLRKERPRPPIEVTHDFDNNRVHLCDRLFHRYDRCGSSCFLSSALVTPGNRGTCGNADHAGRLGALPWSHRRW